MTYLNLNMKIIMALILSFVAGLGMGAFYFLTLWQTVRKLSSAKNRVRLMLMSFVIRMTAVMTGFYLVLGNGQWERLALAMLGFIIIRKILTHRLGPQCTAEVC